MHFVIAGALLGIFFRWISLTGKLTWTNGAATALIVIGAVAAWFAVMSGDDAHGVAQRIPGATQAVQLQKNTDGAAAAFASLAAQFPGDQSIQLLAAESLLQDKKDFSGALAALSRIPVPSDSARTRMRYDLDRADAFIGMGQKDSARTILTALAAKSPTSKPIQDRLDKLK